MNEEIEFLHKNQTWELVKPPIKNRIVGYNGFTLTVEDVKYKTRLVAKGYG